jgi:Fur family ferric uptake transcriptional regulator
MNQDLFNQLLKTNGLSITKERSEMFSILKNKSEPISISELVKTSEPIINRSTVYRTIDTFEKIGVITKIYSGWKYKIELSNDFNHHHHLTCTQCSKVFEFKESPNLLKQLNKIGEQKQFLVTSHSLELKGLCSTCCYNKNI